jgi:tetratricopeptide (TPR) repeat protein
MAAAALLVPVRAAEPDEPWIKVTTEHFTILTPAGEAVARKWAAELEQFRRGLQNIVPVDVTRLRPVTVVLFKNDRAMEPYVPLERGVPAKVGGLFVRANDLNTIMLSLSRDVTETRHVIFHEAVHWHLSALDGIMPLWLGEGLAELYATFEMPDAKTFAFGAARPAYVRQLTSGRILPLLQLISIDRDSLLYNEGTRTSIFYAQSWAFVHFLFYGDDSPGRAALIHYLELLRNTDSPDAAFATAFGGDYAELERRLRRYIKGGSYRKHFYARSTDNIARLLRVAPATLADRALAKGSLLFGTRTPDDAEPPLRQAAELAPGDPRAWELLGHIAIARRDFGAAAATLAKAAAAGSTSYLVYHNLAVSRLPEPGAGAPSAFDPGAMDAAAADYRRAVELAPSHVPSYEGLAGLIYGMQSFEPLDLELLHRGLLQSPNNAMIETGIAAGEIRAGRGAEGRARLERIVGRHAGRSDAGTRFARRILADETLRAELDEIERLAKQNRFAEVVAVADRALGRDLEPAHRQILTTARQRMHDFKKIIEAVELANLGQVTAATGLLEALVLSNPDPAAKAEAQRLLREIARQTAPSGGR